RRLRRAIARRCRGEIRDQDRRLAKASRRLVVDVADRIGSHHDEYRGPPDRHRAVAPTAPGRRGTPDFGFAVSGGAAQDAVVDQLAVKPPSVSWEVAAGLPHVVEAAVRTLDLLGVTAGSTVLINGAAGGVGVSATQFAGGVARRSSPRRARTPRLPALARRD